MSDKHVIAILLENEAGVLFRVAGLFSARGYNIESLTVAKTHDRKLSRMTVVTEGSDKLVNQVINQLNKLVGIVKIQDLSKGEHTERETVLVKVQYSVVSGDASSLKEVAQQYNANIVACEEGTCLFELTAATAEIDRFINTLNRHSIVEVVRSGVISLGSEILG